MVMPQAIATADDQQRVPAPEPIDDAHTPDAGGQRGKSERRAVQRGDDAGEIELLAQLAEHGADAEPTDEQRIAERRGVGEPIPPELVGDDGGSRSHPPLYQ